MKGLVRREVVINLPYFRSPAGVVGLGLSAENGLLQLSDQGKFGF